MQGEAAEPHAAATYLVLLLGRLGRNSRQDLSLMTLCYKHVNEQKVSGLEQRQNHGL